MQRDYFASTLKTTLPKTDESVWGRVADWKKPPLHTHCSCHKHRDKPLNHPLAVSQTHLEKVILVHNATVGQRLNQPVCQGCFPPISDPKSKEYIELLSCKNSQYL